MKSRPNIILIMADQLRPDAIGKFTPNLMKLAEEGVRFTNAYCGSPLCQPSRNCIITGLPTSIHGVCGNQNDPVTDTLRGDTFMHHLRSSGWKTALIGKHHYIDRFGIGIDVVDADQEAVEAYGFDHVTQALDDGENMHNSDSYTRYLEETGKLEEFQEGFKNRGSYIHPFEPDESADGFIGNKGVEYVKNVDAGSPFYLNLSFIGPHPPYWHPGELKIDLSEVAPPLCGEDSPVVRERRAHYLQKCALIDDYTGRLVEALKDRDLYDNTLIIFTADHGDNLGDFDVWDKRHFYEQSAGVPLIMRGPGAPCMERKNGARLSRALVSQLDLYPTILAAAGVEAPETFNRQGQDILKMVRGESPLHKAVFAELATCVMIRSAMWKMVFDPEQGGVRYLFNMSADPMETVNLAGRPEYDGVVKTLLEEILAWRIRNTQKTQIKEEQRLQSVRSG